jgi:hypothetical protein
MLPIESNRHQNISIQLIDTLTVLCCAVLCCAVLCCAVLCCAVIAALIGHRVGCFLPPRLTLPQLAGRRVAVEVDSRNIEQAM